MEASCQPEGLSLCRLNALLRVCWFCWARVVCDSRPQTYLVSSPTKCHTLSASNAKTVREPFGVEIAVAVRMAHESELDDLRGICSSEASLVDLQGPDLRLQSGSRYTEFGCGAGGPVHSASAFAQCSLDNRFFLGGKALK